MSLYYEALTISLNKVMQSPSVGGLSNYFLPYVNEMILPHWPFKVLFMLNITKQYYDLGVLGLRGLSFHIKSFQLIYPLICWMKFFTLTGYLVMPKQSFRNVRRAFWTLQAWFWKFTLGCSELKWKKEETDCWDQDVTCRDRKHTAWPQTDM